MRYRLAGRTAATLLTVASASSLLLPLSAEAATYSMRTTHIILNGKTVSTQKAFTYQNTTFMPLFYVQQVLSSLGIKNDWDGSKSPQTWSLHTPGNADTSLRLISKTGSVTISVNGVAVCQHVTMVVTTDPYSHKPTTFVPVWYIQQVIEKSLGLKDHWDGFTWTITSNYTAYSKSGNVIGSYPTLDAAKSAMRQYSGGVVKNPSGSVVYTQPDFVNVDLRFPAPSNVNASSIDKFFADHSSPLAGLGSSFVAAQNVYGVDANYLVGHAIVESAWGKSPIALSKDNLFGYGAYDSTYGAAAGTYPSLDYAIRFQAWEVRNNYLNPGTSHYVAPTLSGMGHNYASSGEWADAIGSVMNQFAINVNDSVFSYPQYNPSTPAPAASSSTVPVFYLNGAQGAVVQPQFYSGLPVYPDMGTGVTEMFTRELKKGNVGDDVTTLQQLLNQRLGLSLATDGQFGDNTLAAVQQFQQANNLPVTGTVDFNMWNNVLQIGNNVPQLPAGSPVTIDQMEQGMAGGIVTEWYHVAGQGWVNGDNVSLANVYRLTVPNPTSPSDTSIPVYDASNPSTVIATLHAGDMMVSTIPGQTGNLQIQFANQDNGQLLTGVVNAATLTQAGVVK